MNRPDKQCVDVLAKFNASLSLSLFLVQNQEDCSNLVSFFCLPYPPITG